MFRIDGSVPARTTAEQPVRLGRPRAVEALLGRHFDLTIDDHTSTLDIESGEAYWALFSTGYRPTKALADSLDDDRREALDRTWVEFFEREFPGESGTVAHLLTVGMRR
jgi:hypothetical protein